MSSSSGRRARHWQQARCNKRAFPRAWLLRRWRPRRAPTEECREGVGTRPRASQRVQPRCTLPQCMPRPAAPPGVLGGDRKSLFNTTPRRRRSRRPGRPLPSSRNRRPQHRLAAPNRRSPFDAGPRQGLPTRVALVPTPFRRRLLPPSSTTPRDSPRATPLLPQYSTTRHGAHSVHYLGRRCSRSRRGPCCSMWTGRSCCRGRARERNAPSAHFLNQERAGVISLPPLAVPHRRCPALHLLLDSPPRFLPPFPVPASRPPSSRRSLPSLEVTCSFERTPPPPRTSHLHRPCSCTSSARLF